MARVMVRWILGLAAVLGGCTSPHKPVDSQCAFNGDCEEDLVCFARYCRAQCRTDRDCANMYRCVPSDDPGKSVCVPPTSPGYCQYASQCPSPMVCAADGSCTMQCRDRRDCRYGDLCGACLPSGVCSFHPAVSDGGNGGATTCDEPDASTSD